jgi:hypothetical protein
MNTGYSIYNQLGLTTQISNTIQIGKNQIRSGFKRDRYTISFIKQPNTITKDNIRLLQILDAIRYIKKIPDITLEMSCKRLLAILQTLSDKELLTLVRLALKYPPATRALLGALLNQIQPTQLTGQLLKGLNPVSKYKFPGVTQVLENSVKWNIV